MRALTRAVFSFRLSSLPPSLPCAVPPSFPSPHVLPRGRWGLVFELGAGGVLRKLLTSRFRPEACGAGQVSGLGQPGGRSDDSAGGGQRAPGG